MRILALDSTTRAGSVAIVDAGRVLLERVGDGARTHAERLPGELLEALDGIGLRTNDIDLFAVARGPGSFTGLRIGIATIQGLAFVHGTHVAAISALHALGAAAGCRLPIGARVGAWMDAYRGDVYSALYEVVGASPAGTLPALAEVEGAMVGAPEETWARWARIGEPVQICGDGAVRYASVPPDTVTVIPAPPLASVIGHLAFQAHEAGATVTPGGVQPLYVRRPDAEIAREAARLSR
jgi:tRNA threonylcarbamoyladenosine biosynthesis protein TsaB